MLPAEAYTSCDQFSRESTSLFEDAWHCVAQTNDVNKEGSLKRFSFLVTHSFCGALKVRSDVISMFVLIDIACSQENQMAQCHS